jgi:hypothetical protein
MKHPTESPYLYTGGNPIYFVDPDGRDRIDYYKIITNKGTVQIKVVTAHSFKAEMQFNYNREPDLVKYNYNVYHTYDFRDGKVNISTKEQTDYASGIWDIGKLEFLQIKLTGNDNALAFLGMPQAVIYGSGIEDPGFWPKADSKKSILSLNFAELSDIMGNAMVGMKDYTIRPAIEKIPDLEYKIGKEITNKLNKNQSSITPVEEDNPAARTEVYVREDDYGNGSSREKKGSIQNHAYVTDSVTRKRSGRNGSNVDTTFIRKQKRSFVSQEKKRKQL